MSLRFPLRVKPEVDESIRGFVMRLAARNAHTVSAVATVVDLDMAALTTSPAAVARLAKASGQEQAIIERMAYQRVGALVQSRANFRGHLIDSRLIHMAPRRFCPACLAEAPYHRAIWDIRNMTACPKHGAKLVGACSCGSKPGWHALPLERCTCSGRFDAMLTERASEGDVRASGTVDDLLNGRIGHIHERWAGRAVGAQLSDFWFQRTGRGLPRIRRPVTVSKQSDFPGLKFGDNFRGRN